MIFHKSSYLLLLAVLLASGSTNAVPNLTDAEWIRLNTGDYPGTNGVINAVARYRENIYVGGCFSKAGNVEAANVAKWNGSTWSALGSGITANGYLIPVYALACDSSGNLYVGGHFDTAGGMLAKNVARWDGYRWNSLGKGANNDVLALTFDSAGSLYAGGVFDSIGGTGVSGIGRWDGSRWHSLGGGTHLAIIQAIACKGNQVFAGGLFDSIGNTPVAKLARWDGTSWSSPGDAFRPLEQAFFSKQVFALAFDSKGDLYVGGKFDSVSNIKAKNIARWDGVAWKDVGGGVEDDQSTIYSLVFDSRDMLYAGGGFYRAGDNVPVRHVARWNGNFWYSLGSGLDSTGRARALTIDETGELIIGGAFKTVSGTSAYNIARWSGFSGSALGNGIDGSVTTIAVGTNGKLAIGGHFTTIGGQYSRLVAERENGLWRSPDSGISGEVRALTYGVNGDLFAAGLRTDTSITGFTFNGGALRQWNGTTWSDIRTDYYLTYFSVVSKENCCIFTGGYSYNGSRYQIAMWDGTEVTPISPGVKRASYDASPYVYAMAVDSSGDLYIGGVFDSAGSIEAKNIAQWDGSTWQSLGDGLNGQIRALAIDRRGNLYAGGSFDSAGGVYVSGIARWDGVSWDSLSTGVKGSIFALACDDSGTLYVGGQFDTAGTIPVRNIASWDGAEWSPVGSGTDREVLTLAVSGSILYVGGSFTKAGDKVSPSIAAVTLYGNSRTVRKNNLPHAPKTIFRNSGRFLQFGETENPDNYSLFSLSGRKMNTHKGKSLVDLSNRASQLLIVRCKNNAHSAGMVIKK